MGTVYLRGNVWWIGYRDAAGKWQYDSAGTSDKREAERRLKAIEAAIERGSVIASKPKTVAAFGTAWAAERRSRPADEGRVWTASKDLQRLKSHAFPVLGDVRLDEMRPSQVQAWFDGLKRKQVPKHKGSKETMKLAPRTLRNIFGALHAMFEDAKAAELVTDNPCILKSGQMPAIVDKDPDWRDDAVFTREEVELLISTDKIKEHHRIWWAIGFLAAMRAGEVGALRWRRYLRNETPMPMIQVRFSYNLEFKCEKPTKTGRTRDVPVHPTLAIILDDWKANGWRKYMGRDPGPDDLVVPNELGEHLTENSTRDTRPADLAKLGLRLRRFHDGRATFITLGTVDGAEEVWLERVTHNAKGNQHSQYRRTVWLKLCEAVSCLNITLRPPRAGVLQNVLQSSSGATQMPETSGGEGDVPRGIRTPAAYQSSGVVAERLRAVEWSCSGVSVPVGAADRSNVGSPRTARLGRRARALAARFRSAR